MEAVFLKLLNMSITAGWIVLAVVLLRPLLQKAPKWTRCVLWAFVALRLICPFTIESVLSLVPSSETIPQDIVYQQEPEIHSGVGFVNSVVNPVISDSMAPNPGDSANPLQIVSFIATWVWVIGMVVMVLYTLISYIRLRLKVMEAVPLKDNILICDHISTPFILGIFRPRIYLPSSMNEGDMEYVIAHEKAHIKRRDHWWKPLGFVLLTVYWFNPLIWVAYILLCRDIEMACDEKVIGKMDATGKISYSEALLNCSVSRKSIAACPLAFGEVGVKARIKSVLNYKKPAFWIMIAAIVACVAVAVCFLTDPSDKVIKQRCISSNSDITLKVMSIDMEADEPHIRLKWINDSDKTIVYGSLYNFYKEIDGQWELMGSTEAQFSEGSLWAGEENEFDTLVEFFDFTEAGKYRIETDFRCQESSSEKSRMAVEFYLEEGLGYKAKGVGQQESGSDYEGISLKVVSVNTGTYPATISIEWINNTEEEFTIGESYYICKQVGQEWVECGKAGVWNLIATGIKSGKTLKKDYGLDTFDLSEAGMYRFGSVVDENTGKKVWVDFYLEEAVNIKSKTFDILDTGSEIEGLSMSIISIDPESAYAMSIRWFNITDYSFLYENEYCVYKEVDGAWVSCGDAVKGKSTVYSEKGTSEIPYNLSSFDMSQPGKYRFECKPLGGKGDKVWVDFYLNSIIIAEEGSPTLYPAYKHESQDGFDNPYIILTQDYSGFQLHQSPLSSHIDVGYYEVRDNKLYLNGLDDSGFFVFDIVDNTLVFRAAESRGVFSYRDGDGSTNIAMPDGAVFKGEYIGDSHDFTVSLDYVDYDIDSDGVKEVCSIRHGNTSGRFTIDFVITEADGSEKITTMDMEPGDFSFVEKDDGTVQVRYETVGYKAQVIYYDVLYGNGAVALSQR